MSSDENTNTVLPIIDISPYLNSESKDDAARKATSTALHNACLNFGFFYLNIAKYVDTSETDELTRLAREFFALPQEEKDKLSLSNQDSARGYARLQENVTNGLADNHEGIDFYRPVEEPDKTKLLWGENQWPAVLGFRAKYEKWVEKMKALGLVVMEAMAIGLGMTHVEWKELRSQVDDSFWVMRVIGYPPLPNGYDGFSCGAHKDYGCLTFLYADPTPAALQVFLSHLGETAHSAKTLDLGKLPAAERSKDGVWINADPIPGCIVCNIGEMWEIWSNGLYKSTLHRVMHRGANYRIPFFFEPNFEAHIKPLAAARRITNSEEKKVDDLQGSSHKEYHAVVYGDFLKAKVGNNFYSSAGGDI